MNRPRIAPLGIALALGLTATVASATHGDSLYRTHRGDIYVHPAPVEVRRVEYVAPGEVIRYTDHYVTPAPATNVVVEREYYVAPRETIVVQADASYPYAFADPLHPHWGHLLDYGLFNSYGPNDFGR